MFFRLIVYSISTFALLHDMKYIKPKYNASHHIPKYKSWRSFCRTQTFIFIWNKDIHLVYMKIWSREQPYRISIYDLSTSNLDSSVLIRRSTISLLLIYNCITSCILYCIGNKFCISSRTTFLGIPYSICILNVTAIKSSPIM